MWPCTGVLSISESNLYNDRISDVCKKYINLKLRAPRQCSEVLLGYLSFLFFFFLFFYIYIYNNRRYPEDIWKQCDSAIMLTIQAYLGALPVFSLESLSWIKTRFLGLLLCMVCRRWETTFKVCFVIIGAIKHDCCAHVVEIIQKIHLQ